MRTAVLALALTLAVAAPAAAQTSAQGSGPDQGRFVLRETPDGLLRMDTATGAMSLCTRRDGQFACRPVTDDRSALEAEVLRLREENASLRQAAGQTRPAPGLAPSPPAQLPSDVEVDRALSIVERVWRRFMEMMRDTPPPGEPGRRL